MRKEEVIALHETLARIRRSLDQRAPASSAFARYDALGIQPEHRHRVKAAHATAVLHLAAGIDAVVARQSRSTNTTERR